MPTAYCQHGNAWGNCRTCSDAAEEAAADMAKSGLTWVPHPATCAHGRQINEECPGCGRFAPAGEPPSPVPATCPHGFRLDESCVRCGRPVSLVTHDAVNHPKHYTAHPSGIECIEITRHMGFNLGNVMKYIWRADEKGKTIEDLEKAAWYLADEIKKRKQE